MTEPLRIAMDIGAIAAWEQMSIGKVGITRAVESLAQALGVRADARLTLAGLCGDEPLYYSYLATLFPRHAWGAAIAAEPTVRSRFGLGALYRTLMPAYLADLARQTTPNDRLPLRSTLLRGGVKVLKIADTRPHFDAGKFDVFLSTTMPLPPRAVTGDLPRAMMIFDLICVRQPEWVTSAQTQNQQAVLDSIDTERDWVLCNSEFVRQDVCDYLGIKPERVFMVPLGASEDFHPVADAAERTAVRAKYHLPPGDYLLTLAAFQPRKNVPAILRAFGQLVAQHPELPPVSLVMAGKPGQSTNEIDAALESLGAARDRVVATGYVADEDLSALYSGARAFVFPSLAEGFGLPPLEAMRCRVPVITSTTTSLPEVVGDTALLVDPTDESAICRAMYDLLADPARAERAAQAGWERAQNYTWQNSAQTMVDCLCHISEAARR